VMVVWGAINLVLPGLTWCRLAMSMATRMPALRVGFVVGKPVRSASRPGMEYRHDVGPA
jgi:hypothetical protein